jgi:hypothetical protein
VRTIVVLLLAANVTFFLYRWLDQSSVGETTRTAQQVHAEKIKLLTPQQVAALGPAKTAALADVCVEWGPLTDAERGRVLAQLDALALGRLLTQKRVETSGTWWVYLAPPSGRFEADRRAADLRNRGLDDVAVVDGGGQRFTVSLGVFRTEEAANAHLDALTRLGVGAARAGPRQQAVALTSLVVRDPPAAVVARLRELSASHPGVELRTGACEKT